MPEENTSEQNLIEKLKALRWKAILYFSKSQRVKLLMLVLIIVSLPLAVLVANRVVKYRSKAQVTPVSLYLVPSDQHLPPDSNFQIMLDALTNQIGFVRIELSFDHSKINLTNEIQTTPSLANVIEKTTKADANSTGQVVIVLGLATTDLGNPPTGVFEIANFQVTGVTPDPDQTASISFNDSGIQVVDTVPQALTFSTLPANLTLNSTTVNPTASLYFSAIRPANPQTVDNNFAVDVLVDTGGQNIDGVDAKLRFDTSFLNIVDLQSNPNSPFSSYPALIYDNSTGTINISANVGSGPSATPVNGSDINIATITVRPVTQTSLTQITYDFVAGERNDSNIVLSGTPLDQDPVDILATVSDLDIIISGPTVTATPTPTQAPPTQTPTPTPTDIPNQPTSTPIPPTSTPVPTDTPTPTSPPPMSVIIKLLFQGKTRPGISNAKSLTIHYKTLTGTVQGPVNLDSDMSGEAQFSIDPGNYFLLIKAPGYLAKRFGSLTEPIVVSTSQATIDLSYSPLIGGDFNGDGVINEVDYSLNFLTSFLGSDLVVDLDGSGEVNNLDFGIMRSNWSLVDDTI